MEKAKQSNLLRKDDNEENKASFPELFFDLVFVFALIQLSETLAAEFTFGIAAEAILFIFALWWVWVHTTWVTNLLDAEAVPVRLLLFFLMFCGIVLAIALPKAFVDQGLAFAIAYSAMQLGRCLFALYAFWGTNKASLKTFIRITIWLAMSSILWISGGLSDTEQRVLLWTAALVIEYAGPFLKYWLPGIGGSPDETLDINGELLAERCALFVIICLGETILTTGKNASAHLASDGTILILACAFLSTVLMWWLYFHDGQEKAADKADQSAKPQTTAQNLFTYGHLPIIAGIILTAVGEDFSLSEPDKTGSYTHAAALLGGPILFLIGMVWMKFAASKIVPYSHVVGIAALALSLLIVPTSPNFIIQIFATLLLLVVAVWEYVALEKAKPKAA
jgi:low temperature requirement protein LtrA